MPRHADIELTSQAPDGSWRWRAAGARQPRGVLASVLVPQGVRLGDVVRAEIESGLEGIEVLSVLPIRAVRTEDAAQRIEVIGSARPEPGVAVPAVSTARHRAGNGERRGPDQREASTGHRRRARGERSAPGREDDAEPTRGTGTRPHREERDGSARAPRRPQRPSIPTGHRNAALAGLRPEQLPVAEQLLRGGIPAVRQAIQAQQAAERAAGRAPVATETLLSMAEELLPVVNLAAWKDRATAASNAGHSTRLRELRAVVAASRAINLDDEAREMAAGLHESLNQRVRALREEWQGRVVSALDSGKVLEALVIAARPPDVSTRFPGDLALRLAQSAGEAMTQDTPAGEWLDLLAAVRESPVRPRVRPSGVPDTQETKEAARKAAGLVPELARLIGLPIPPPPPRRARPAQLTRSGGAGPEASS